MSGEKSLAREYLEALLIAVVFATFARTYVVQAFKIPSGSMEKNLLIGDHILVNKFVYAPRLSSLEEKLLPLRTVGPGDVVVFKFPDNPSRDFIKRCLGMPGDTLRLDDKQLYRNEQRVDEKAYTYYAEDDLPEGSLFGVRRRRPPFGPATVGAVSYFCMGDNRDNSNDSRVWGTVPSAYVKGRALMVYWSIESESELMEWPGWRGRLRQLRDLATHFFSRTRWTRTFRIVR
jgi:signal peptidase I